MKQFLLFTIPLTLISLNANAQFAAGAKGFHIVKGTPVALDGLTLIPDPGDLTLTNKILSVTSIPVQATHRQY
ncbi:hypothetical protein [Dyadobacter frigoris]|uniref:Uncharacterized protein n=1 Tax=Dyadobacter frigoris TaxID=2576211 RepID=A0A4U6D926_9BACT|nr:hypothetical protein [Dyadobacter frigoris]TKT90714.1 hypothetical protein FDK13_17240 [Dyadobacter frigoris]